MTEEDAKKLAEYFSWLFHPGFTPEDKIKNIIKICEAYESLKNK